MEYEATICIEVTTGGGSEQVRPVIVEVFKDMMELGIVVEEKKFCGEPHQLRISATCPYDVFMGHIEKRLLATKTSIGKKIEDAVDKYKKGVINIAFSDGKIDSSSIDHPLSSLCKGGDFSIARQQLQADVAHLEKTGEQRDNVAVVSFEDKMRKHNETERLVKEVAGFLRTECHKATKRRHQEKKKDG